MFLTLVFPCSESFFGDKIISYLIQGSFMARKEISEEKQNTKIEGTALSSESDRETNILNAMANTTILLMSTMMGAFTNLMVAATSAMASGMAEAMGGKEAEDKVSQEIKEGTPEINEKIKAMISDMRKDIYAQMTKKKQEFESLLSDPAFDVGPRIIEKYDFKLPKLTQELDDNALSQYTQLLIREDESFAKMFKELAEWIGSLPKPDETSQQKT
jgi:Spy/CpxP family protein refolding chaperone